MPPSDLRAELPVNEGPALMREGSKRNDAVDRARVSATLRRTLSTAA
jgi:hypothetical protein